MSESHPIEFFATMQGTSCIRFDDDGSAVIKLTADGQQLPSVVQMLRMQGKVFKVIVEGQGDMD